MRMRVGDVLCGNGFFTLLIFALERLCIASVDLSISHLQYVADRITVDECRRLVAALRLDTLEYPGEGAVDTEARLLEDGEACVVRLMRWKDLQDPEAARSVLRRRLVQMGHKDLADRLSEAVFAVLSESITEADAATPQAFEATPQGNLEELPKTDNLPESDGWTTIDTILCVGIVCTLVLLFGFAGFALVCRCRRVERDGQGGDETASSPLL